MFLRFYRYHRLIAKTCSNRHSEQPSPGHQNQNKSAEHFQELIILMSAELLLETFYKSMHILAKCCQKCHFCQFCEN